jgi:primosomal protein N' (replication factor Y) (superfamily II helicase)
MTKKYVSVALDNNIQKLLDYSIPKHLLDKVQIGSRIEVPLRNTIVKGYVFDIKAKPSFDKVKDIKDVVYEKVISKDLFELIKWMSSYYFVSIETILRKIIPAGIRNKVSQKSFTFLSINKTKSELVKICQKLRLKSPTQAHLIELFLKSKEKGFYLKDIVENLKISRSPIDCLVRKKILQAKNVIEEDDGFLLDEEYFLTKPKKLTDEQEISLGKINKSLDENIFAPHLIYGVTGSGKTEIYLQAIQKALDQKKSVIMMVPEIALTSQTIERFKARFKEKLSILHYRRSDGQKNTAWNDIISNKTSITIGARSAIFAPVQNLGLVIVDEEHDSSYKQTDEMPTLNARNIAIVRAKLANATVVLGSATPSLESYKNALENKYILSSLTKRANSAILPKVHIVDIKREMEKSKFFNYFTGPLLDKIKERFDRGEQSLLFLNKRGFFSFLICSDCKKTIKCPHCDLTLTFHKSENILACHLCNFVSEPIKQCPHCKKHDFLKYRGMGTENVEATLNKIFPQIRTMRIDRDTTSKKNSHEKLLKAFRSGKADVLIGTQMIVKGLHFPSVTLVGVLNSDGALNIPDFRSAEVVMQLMTQVAGRSGRAELPGEVVIQTYMPDNDIIKFAAKQDFENFYKHEIELRKLFNYPPFTQMIKFVLTSENETQAQNIAIDMRSNLINDLPSTYDIHPVIACGRAKIKDKYRFQFIIRGKSHKFLKEKISNLKNSYRLPKNVKLFIDVDPTSTFF